MTVDPDPEQAGADSIGPKGGTVSLETDTATYQLVVPAGALLSETRIRMQELHASSGPTNGKFSGGLQFEPEGLEFADAATLKITLKTPLNRRGIGLVWLYDGKGDDAHLAPYKIEGNTISRPIAHFSGMVVRNPWTKEEISRFGIEVEGPQRTPFDRLQHQAGKVVADNRSCALRPPTDGCPDNANEVLQSLFDSYRNGPLTASLANLASSDATCGQAAKVGLESMEYLRESELLGLNADASMWDPSISAGTQAGGKLSVFGKGAQLCLKEAAKECELGHDIDGPVKQAHLAQRRRR